jgi:hypothetical protein
MMRVTILAKLAGGEPSNYVFRHNLGALKAVPVGA